MECNVVKNLNQAWDEAIFTILDVKELPVERLQQLIKDTYEVLTRFQGEEMIPKALSKTLLLMGEYCYFANVMEENEKGEGYYYWRPVRCIIETLKRDFFGSGYACAFPRLRVVDLWENESVLDLDSDFLKVYAASLRQQRTPEIREN